MWKKLFSLNLVLLMILAVIPFGTVASFANSGDYFIKVGDEVIDVSDLNSGSPTNLYLYVPDESKRADGAVTIYYLDEDSNCYLFGTEWDAFRNISTDRNNPTVLSPVMEAVTGKYILYLNDDSSTPGRPGQPQFESVFGNYRYIQDGITSSRVTLKGADLFTNAYNTEWDLIAWKDLDSISNPGTVYEGYFTWDNGYVSPGSMVKYYKPGDTLVLTSPSANLEAVWGDSNDKVITYHWKDYDGNSVENVSPYGSFVWDLDIPVIRGKYVKGWSTTSVWNGSTPLYGFPNNVAEVQGNDLYAQYGDVPYGPYYTLSCEYGLLNGQIQDVISLPSDGKVNLPSKVKGNRDVVWWFDSDNHWVYECGAAELPTDGNYHYEPILREDWDHLVSIDFRDNEKNFGYGESYDWYDGTKTNTYLYEELLDLANHNNDLYLRVGLKGGKTGTEYMFNDSNFSYRAAQAAEEVNKVASFKVIYAINPRVSKIIKYHWLNWEGTEWESEDQGYISLSGNLWPVQNTKGKYFKGWTTTQNGTGTLYTAANMASEISTSDLYAQYGNLPSTTWYALTYDKGLSNGWMENAFTLPANGRVTLPTKVNGNRDVFYWKGFGSNNYVYLPGEETLPTDGNYWYEPIVLGDWDHYTIIDLNGTNNEYDDRGCNYSYHNGTVENEWFIDDCLHVADYQTYEYRIIGIKGGKTGTVYNIYNSSFNFNTAQIAESDTNGLARFTAVYEENPNYAAITFHYGENNNTIKRFVYYDFSVKLPDWNFAQLEGKYFKGWTENPSGSGTIYVPADGPSSVVNYRQEKNLYAQYGDLPTGRFWYQLVCQTGLANGQAGDAYALPADGNITLPSTVKNGRKVLYWGESSNNEAYEPGSVKLATNKSYFFFPILMGYYDHYTVVDFPDVSNSGHGEKKYLLFNNSGDYSLDTDEFLSQTIELSKYNGVRIGIKGEKTGKTYLFADKNFNFNAAQYAEEDRDGLAKFTVVYATKPSTGGETGGETGGGGGGGGGGGDVAGGGGAPATSTAPVEVKSADGSASKTTTDANGVAKTEATVSAEAAQQAAKEGKPIALPMNEAKPSADAAKAPVVKVDLPDGTAKAKVEIPVKNVSPSIVAVLVKADGTEEIITKTMMSENGIVAELKDGETIKIVDNHREFNDVANNWAKDDIDFITARGVFNGTGNGTFDPKGDMTRGMLMTVLARYDGVDASGKDWQEKGAAWAKSTGISDGTGLTEKVTREQLVTMLWRYAGSPTVSGDAKTSAYADASSIHDYAGTAFDWAVSVGLIQGSDNKLDPSGNAQRGQLAAIMHRFMVMMENK